MEQIKILLYVLGTFFGMEDGRIAADKTTVTIYPESQKIEIIQEHLFAVIQSEKDTTIVLEQWDQLMKAKEKTGPWAKELDSFPVKTFTLKSIEKTLSPHIVLSYASVKELRAMGVWYNAEKNQFSINHSPKEHLNTKDGALVGNYWVFNGDATFSFTIEPFLDIPESYKKFKKPLEEIINGTQPTKQ